MIKGLADYRVDPRKLSVRPGQYGAPSDFKRLTEKALRYDNNYNMQIIRPSRRP